MEPSFRIFCKEDATLSLAIRNGHVILARSDPNDFFQHWIKDDKYSPYVKDKDGLPTFPLVNKGTGQAMKHSSRSQPVELIPYKPSYVVDYSILLSASSSFGDGYRAIRPQNNTDVNLDAYREGSDAIKVRHGTVIGLWDAFHEDTTDGNNQRWMISSF